MAKMETITRRWGNSLGITLPKKFVEEEGLHENQRVVVEVRPAVDLKKVRGLLRTKKTAQQLKDEMREGWE